MTNQNPARLTDDELNAIDVADAEARSILRPTWKIVDSLVAELRAHRAAEAARHRPIGEVPVSDSGGTVEGKPVDDWTILDHYRRLRLVVGWATHPDVRKTGVMVPVNELAALADCVQVLLDLESACRPYLREGETASEGLARLASEVGDAWAKLGHTYADQYEHLADALDSLAKRMNELAQHDVAAVAFNNGKRTNDFLVKAAQGRASRAEATLQQAQARIVELEQERDTARKGLFHRITGWDKDGQTETQIADEVATLRTQLAARERVIAGIREWLEAQFRDSRSRTVGELLAVVLAELARLTAAPETQP